MGQGGGGGGGGGGFVLLKAKKREAKAGPFPERGNRKEEKGNYLRGRWKKKGREKIKDGFVPKAGLRGSAGKLSHGELKMALGRRKTNTFKRQVSAKPRRGKKKNSGEGGKKDP